MLLIADEIQSGLARTGRTFACDHWGVVPDVYLLGKALGGGVVLLSAVVANRDVLGVLNPGEHGSTFEEIRWPRPSEPRLWESCAGESSRIDRRISVNACMHGCVR